MIPSEPMMVELEVEENELVEVETVDSEVVTELALEEALVVSSELELVDSRVLAPEARVSWAAAIKSSAEICSIPSDS